MIRGWSSAVKFPNVADFCNLVRSGLYLVQGNDPIRIPSAEPWRPTSRAASGITAKPTPAPPTITRYKLKLPAASRKACRYDLRLTLVKPGVGRKKLSLRGVYCFIPPKIVVGFVSKVGSRFCDWKWER